jgi:putative flippase GtrA
MMRFTRSPLAHGGFLRFLAAGAVNALFGLGMYSGAILAGLPIWGALAFGNVTGILFNFVSTGHYVFHSAAPARFPAFLLVYLIVYTINLVLIDWLLTVLSGKILAQAILMLPMALLSYVLLKEFVFRSHVGGRRRTSSTPASDASMPDAARGDVQPRQRLR